MLQCNYFIHMIKYFQGDIYARYDSIDKETPTNTDRQVSHMYYSFIFIPLFISYICIHRKFTGTTKKYIHEHFDKWNTCTVLYMVPPFNKTDCTEYIHVCTCIEKNVYRYVCYIL